MSDSSNAPGEVRPSPPKSPAGPNTLAVGCLSGIVSGIVSGVICALICLLAIFVVLPASRSISSMGTVTEEGTVDVAIVGSKGESQVFYKHPFASPPQLTILEGSADTVVTDQKPESFKVTRDVTDRISYTTVITVKWKAEGKPAP
ncbi:MAG: hypothetical protein ACKVP0_23595 [Pirellulaceae bacterium]